MRPDGLPFGVTVLAPGGQDALLASLGRTFHADTALPLGALGIAQPPLAPLPAAPTQGEIALAVVGAHLSGMPLNGELKACGGRFLQEAQTAPDYRLFALDTQPPKPGLLRVHGRAGRRRRARNMGAPRRRLRALRRRDSGAARDRYARARGRPRR